MKFESGCYRYQDSHLKRQNVFFPVGDSIVLEAFQIFSLEFARPKMKCVLSSMPEHWTACVPGKIGQPCSGRSVAGSRKKRCTLLWPSSENRLAPPRCCRARRAWSSRELSTGHSGFVVKHTRDACFPTLNRGRSRQVNWYSVSVVPSALLVGFLPAKWFQRKLVKSWNFSPLKTRRGLLRQLFFQARITGTRTFSAAANLTCSKDWWSQTMGQ